MDPFKISYYRLINQQIAQHNFRTPKEIAGWMGALQAQDFYMSKWAFGVRLPVLNNEKIDSAIEKGEIIRTHVLRPTWHFISSEDIYWMLDLTSDRIRNSMKWRDKELELNEQTYAKSNKIIKQALTDGTHLSREELTSELKNANIPTNENRSSHMLLRAELDGIICGGKTVNQKHMYTLLNDWVPKSKNLSKEESLSRLAMKYFCSHGPATIFDFAWWSGLTIRESNTALEAVKPNLRSTNYEGFEFFYSNQMEDKIINDRSFFFLPAYDEFIISYKDRSASLLISDHRKAISQNGIFRPVIVNQGRIIGIWSRAIKNNKVLIKTEFFKLPDKKIRSKLHESIHSYGLFLNKETEVMIK